ncbi:serine-rich adhesin for platelets isoform X2 [Hylaeus volcanicus]|uniref:serine-rich adhesin for platelets isoform X2 n=1 Tax=Hylaeus volcanicus TaxID=313075 RepID=UPI0023B86EA4|nr:serine-rich adhesin for platelets isoform X2 [Hylaeus volcanicus]
MGQCVSRKAGAVIATGHRDSLTYRIMDKPAKNDHKGASKCGGSHTRGTAMSFGFRRRPTSGIPMPITSYATEATMFHPRSKSAGPEQNRRRDEDNTCAMRNSSSGRSTPRLAPPKKESTGIAVRTNRFGYRQPQPKFTNKVGDICSSHTASHHNQEKLQQQQQLDSFAKQQHRVVQVCNATAPSKAKQTQIPNTQYTNANSNYVDGNRRPSNIPESFGRYTLHTSHLPLPQYAVRMTDANSKVAKTAANQSRKVSAASKSSASSKEGSSTEDSGVGSQQGCPGEIESRGVDYADGSLARRRTIGRPRNLRMVVNGKSFDVRDVRDDDSTVTEISVISLPKTFTATTGLVRERTSQYQRIVNKDNRYTESTTSMSTTSSEGYDEGLGEEKVYKDRSHSEKIPSIKSDFSPPSSDDPEYGHGEAMADEYSLSSSDECHRSGTIQHAETVSHTAKNGTLPKTSLRSVLLTIEDPAFAAAAATSTTLIDDETSPVDSLFDSLTASITQSDVKAARKDNAAEQCEQEDDSPGTPTNASNSLSLSEGREFFDDEIADQPGLVFDDISRTVGDPHSAMASQAHTENSHTLIESSPKTGTGHGKNATNSPHHGKRISRAGSVDTLSPCESIASDDLILDYEQSDASSYEEQHRVESTTALQDMDDAVILSELEAQGEEVMRQWTSLLGTCQTLQQTNNSNTINNNVNSGSANNNNPSTNDIGNECDSTTKKWRSRSVTDSPRSLDGTRRRLISSPLRTSRNVQPSSIDSRVDEECLRVDLDTYQHMFQDIVSMKTMLLKLKRVLQEKRTV